MASRVRRFWGSAKTIAPTAGRSSAPSGVSTSEPNAATTSAKPSVPGATTSRASRSASMTTAPRSASIADTVLLPAATPPVSPTRISVLPQSSQDPVQAGPVPLRQHRQEVLGRVAPDLVENGTALPAGGRRLDAGRASVAGVGLPARPAPPPRARRPPRSPTAERSAARSARSESRTPSRSQTTRSAPAWCGETPASAIASAEPAPQRRAALSSSSPVAVGHGATLADLPSTLIVR